MKIRTAVKSNFILDRDKKNKKAVEDYGYFGDSGDKKEKKAIEDYGIFGDSNNKKNKKAVEDFGYYGESEHYNEGEGASDSDGESEHYEEGDSGLASKLHYVAITCKFFCKNKNPKKQGNIQL